MSIPRTHFFIRTRKDAFAGNKGRHPLCAIRIDTIGNGKVAFVAACSPEDNPCRKTARVILIKKQNEGRSVVVVPNKDTLESVLLASRVPKKLIALLDMDAGERAFERSLEA